MKRKPLLCFTLTMRRHALTQTISAALAIGSPWLLASASPVFNCADSGTGSLRAAVASATNGSTIDMSGLQCSAITLSTGALNVGVDNLTLIGPSTGLSISARTTQPYSQVISHSGTGTITVRSMTLQGGRTTTANGGCISSTGNVVLDHATVRNCSSFKQSLTSCPALGGGVYARSDLTILDSTVAYNSVGCYSSNYNIPPVRVKEYGGGVFAGHKLSVRRSTITGNFAGTGILRSHDYSFGGGIGTSGELEIRDSTVSNNSSGTTDCFYSTSGYAGGIHASNPASSMVITNSTISGNSATVFVGGIFSFAPLSISNSTVAFNSTSADAMTLHGHDYAAGVHVQNTTANLQSTIIANNTFDSCSGKFLSDLSGLNATIVGSNDLIMGSTVAPPGSLTTDPQLSPLAFNGGPTATHQPGPASPAIAHGNNQAGLAFDQRGGGYARSFINKTDIGAFQTGDSMFNSGFD